MNFNHNIYKTERRR